LYDVVIIDSPPLMSVSDSLIISPVIDGFILVVSTDSLKQYEVTRIKDCLEDMGSTVLGVLTNKVSEQRNGSGYGYGYGASATLTERPLPSAV